MHENPSTPNTDAATKALELSLERSLERHAAPYSLASNPQIDAIVKQFAQALGRKSTTLKVTVSDIVNWAVRYAELTNTIVPQELTNAWSLGKYLKSHHVNCGLQNIGTYGNRQVYVATSQGE